MDDIRVPIVGDLDDYQSLAVYTAVYPDKHKVTYPALGLANEAGEVLGKLKKLMRDEGAELSDLSDDQKEIIVDEMGDVLWYLASLASDLDVSLQYAANKNITKLYSRKARGVLGGSGDDR